MRPNKIEKLQLWGINGFREFSHTKWHHLDSVESPDEKQAKVDEYRNAYGEDWLFDWRSECDGAGWTGPVEGSES